jgi:hypothetical protein
MFPIQRSAVVMGRQEAVQMIVWFDNFPLFDLAAGDLDSAGRGIKTPPCQVGADLLFLVRPLVKT